MPCCAAMRATFENNKHLNFKWRGGEGVWNVLFPKVTSLGDNVSTILWPIVACRDMKQVGSLESTKES